MKNIIYDRGDIVKFRYDGIVIVGEVRIADRYILSKSKEQVTYDIYSEEQNCLYKHIDESDVLEKC